MLWSATGASKPMDQKSNIYTGAALGLYIVINYINLFVFEDEIEMKNRSTIQTLTFVHTNPDHLYMKLVVVHANIQFRFEKIGSCKNFSWLLYWLLTFKTGTWRFFWLLLSPRRFLRAWVAQ
jgi:hypothetical protein